MRMRQGYFLISFFAHAQKLVRQGYFFYIFFTLLTELCLLGLGLGGFFRLGFVGVGSTPFGCAVKSRPKVCYMTTLVYFALAFSHVCIFFMPVNKKGSCDLTEREGGITELLG